jgi:hypothetical protein
MFFVVDLGGVVFRFPNNLEKNLKHPSKYKILRSKTVEEVSRTDERADMGKLICRFDFHSQIFP